MTALCVTLDQKRCTGLGLCESFAPDVFEVTDDGSMTLLQAEVGPELQDAVQQAVDSCPTEALRLGG